jgi:hypothetical protein
MKGIWESGFPTGEARRVGLPLLVIHSLRDGFTFLSRLGTGCFAQLEREN